MIKISEQDIQNFERDGAVLIRAAFDSTWVVAMQAAVDEVLVTSTSQRVIGNETAGGKFSLDRDLWLRKEIFKRYVFDSPAAHIAGQLMRSQKVNFFFDQLFVKEPGTLTPTPWHHDQPYWPVSGTQVCSVWLALDVVTKASSGLEYVKGSHRWGKQFTPVKFASGEKHIDVGDTIPDINNHRDQYEFLSWDMQPGDCLVHQALELHGSSGNTSLTQRRRAYATRWTGDDARYQPTDFTFDTDLIHDALTVGGVMDSEYFPVVINR